MWLILPTVRLRNVVRDTRFVGPALLDLILAVINKKNVIKIYKRTEIRRMRLRCFLLFGIVIIS